MLPLLHRKSVPAPEHQLLFSTELFLYNTSFQNFSKGFKCIQQKDIWGFFLFVKTGFDIQFKIFMETTKLTKYAENESQRMNINFRNKNPITEGAALQICRLR